ncbi:glycosyltransferase family 4 protein [Falsiroseomonas sp. CW058]|uniref:glycosyltransferase family 4 protein n=1 Tax=Falsiroseomonas sp. CW058 TaxID=3388664 RepID=UPI003D31E89F
MPFDAGRRVHLPAGAGTAPPVLYVLPAPGAEPPETEQATAAEMEGLRGLGRPVVAFRLGMPAADAPWRAAAHAAMRGGRLGAMARNPLGLARATSFAMAQRAMPPRAALRLGARVAAAARLHGCGRVHAASTDAAATAALLGARMAGLPASIAATGRDVYADATDLPLKLRAADLVLAACTEMAQDLRDLAPRSRVRAVNRGVDTDLFRPEPGIERNGRLLCLAPLVPRSGVSTLLAALGELPPEQRPVVDVIGAGPLLEALRAEALERQVSDHVRFLGRRGRRWIAEEAQRYLGLVAPGVVAPDGDRDPAPVGVLQAMALELPVVASALMAMREVVQPDCGHLVPAGEATPLARGMRWLHAMPEDLRRRLGRAGRDRVLAGYTMVQRATRLAQALG